MLFRDKLDEIRKKLEPEFEKLFQLALKNQSHEGDLLLVAVNGSFSPDFVGFELSGGELSSGYLTGPGSSGLADSTHYEFIHAYRKDIHHDSLDEYLKLHVYSKERKEEIDQLVKAEQISIHLETLIYLKIWEGDYFGKIWYHFVDCLCGKPYNWHFKVKSTSRDSEGIAVRHELIRELIRDRIKSFSEVIYGAFKTAYNTQIRNTIAHSNFSFLSRNLHPNNYVKGDPANSLQNLEFNQWIEMFHTTIILHNYYIWLKNRINRHYGGMFLATRIPQELRIVKPCGQFSYLYKTYRPEFDDWK